MEFDKRVKNRKRYVTFLKLSYIMDEMSLGFKHPYSKLW